MPLDFWVDVDDDDDLLVRWEHLAFEKHFVSKADSFYCIIYKHNAYKNFVLCLSCLLFCIVCV